MMKKIFPCLLFIILFPYFIVFLICSLFHPHLMESVYLNNIYLGLFYLCIFWLAALISAIIVCIYYLVNKSNAVEAARINMLIKIFQIPAYFFLFAVGIVCLLTIFTFAISLVLMIFDCASIMLSGLVGMSAVRRSYKEGVLAKAEMVIYSILQFVFCLDVISSIIVFRKTKEKNISKNAMDRII